MGKNHLGLRRSGGNGSSPRVGGLAKGKTGGLAADIHLKRPYLPETPQENSRDADDTGRVSGVGTKK
jgi:hypothetical protein